METVFVAEMMKAQEMNSVESCTTLWLYLVSILLVYFSITELWDFKMVKMIPIFILQLKKSHQNLIIYLHFLIGILNSPTIAYKAVSDLLTTDDILVFLCMLTTWRKTVTHRPHCVLQRSIHNQGTWDFPPQWLQQEGQWQDESNQCIWGTLATKYPDTKSHKPLSSSPWGRRDTVHVYTYTQSIHEENCVR